MELPILIWFFKETVITTLKLKQLSYLISFTFPRMFVYKNVCGWTNYNTDFVEYPFLDNHWNICVTFELILIWIVHVYWDQWCGICCVLLCYDQVHYFSLTSWRFRLINLRSVKDLLICIWIQIFCGCCIMSLCLAVAAYSGAMSSCSPES